MIDAEMAVWDAGAIQPIIEEAGGTFTDWQGAPTIHCGEGIGTNKHVLEQVLEITRSFPKESAAH
jgi:fructose-1,6-bisphosphatase/inositol monophosphatase family enzyme